MANSLASVTAKLTLDTTGFDGPMKKSEETSTASSRAMAEAAKRSAEAQAFAAKFAGDAVTEQTLRIIAARKNESAASADMRKAQSLMKAGYLGEPGGAELAAAALQRLTLAKEATAAASKVEAAMVEHAGHASVSQMQATSAAVRSLEGNPGIRAVERFLTTIPGVGAALKVAFPVIGAMAFGAVVVEMGEKVVEFIKKVNEMPKEIEHGFASLNLSQKTAADELILKNDELQNSINKLQGKSQDNLKIQFDEATVAADKFAASIEASNTKLNELLSKSHLSAWAILTGTAGTAGREGTAKAFAVQADSNAYDLANATTPAQTAAARKALADTQNAQLAEARQDLAKRQSGDQTGANQASNIAIDKGVITTILNDKKREAAQQLNADLEAAEKKQQAVNEAQRKAAEARRKADEATFKAMEDALNLQKLAGAVTLKWEYNYWNERIGEFTKGSDKYHEVLAKEATLAIEGAKKAQETIKRFTDAQKRESGGSDVQAVQASNERITSQRRKDAVKDAGDQNQDYVNANQASIVQARSDAMVKEAKINDEAGRSITRVAAAMQLAQVHVKEAAIVMQSLEASRNVAARQAGIDPSKENNKALAEAQAKIVEYLAKLEIQKRGDEENMYGRQTSAAVGAADALNKFANDTRDAAKQMREIINSAFKGVNENIVNAAMGRKTNFRGVGESLAQQGVGAVLEKTEGSALNLLGFGGAGKQGTKGNPMWVINAEKGIASAAGSVTGAMGGLLGKLNDSNWMGSLFGGKLFGSGGMFQGHFADGGDVEPGKVAWVGENGPEPFIPKSAGTIIPNHAIGGTTHVTSITNHLDLRQSSDPEAMRAAFRAATPHLVGASVQVQHQRSLRTPQKR